MNIVKLQSPGPGKFGSKRVGNSRTKAGQHQLDLFAEGRILQLHSKSAFEEALIKDEQGENEAARKLYHKAIEEGNHTADAYCNLGILMSRENNPVKAIHYLTLSLKHNSRHLEAHFNLANVYSDEGNLKLGKLHYKICIEIDPAFSNSYFNLGLTLAASQEYRQAIEVLKQYREIAPQEDKTAAAELILKLQTMLNSAPKCG